MVRPAQVFISYAHADEAHRERLVAHLAPLQREGLIAPWHDRQILPGSEWEATIDQRLAAADIVLLLVSADFVASDYCYQRELALALERHKRGETRVIPIIVAPVDFGRTPFAKFQALPRDAKPVSAWSNPEEAWLDVARGIRQVIESSSRIDQSQTNQQSSNASGRGPPPWAKMSVWGFVGVLGTVALVTLISTGRTREEPTAPPGLSQEDRQLVETLETAKALLRGSNSLAMTTEASALEPAVEPVPVDPIPVEPLSAEPVNAKARGAEIKPSRSRRAPHDAAPGERQSLSYRAGTPDEFKSLVVAALKDSRLERHDWPCPVELRLSPASATMTVYGRCLCPQGATRERELAVVSSQGGMMPVNIGVKVASGLQEQDWKACP